MDTLSSYRGAVTRVLPSKLFMMLSPLTPEDLKANIDALQLMEALLEPLHAVQQVLKEQSYLIKEPDLALSDLQQAGGPETLCISTTTTMTPTSKNPPCGLITTPPLLLNREALPQLPTDCNSQINQFKSQFSIQNSQQLASVSQQAAASISRATMAQASAQSLADSANAALVSMQTSASQALSSASSSVSAADENASTASARSSSAVASASSAVASANSSASALVMAASISAASAIVSASSAFSSAIMSASSVVAAAQSSASAAISSASGSIEDAKATATFAISQAKATVSAVNADAAASIKASQVQAITATQAAIAIIGSIIGSSLLSILVYFLLARHKKCKWIQQERKQDMEIKTAYTSGISNIQNRASSSSSARSARMSEPYVQPPSVFEFTLPRQEKKRPFWSFGSAKDLGMTNVTDKETHAEAEPRPSASSRKLTLVYDPDFPAEPPKFQSFDRDTNDFSGFDGDFSGNVAKSEKEAEVERDRSDKRFQRETIGAAI